MRRLLPISVLCLLYYSVAALAVVAPIGCGGGEATKTGAQVAIPVQETEAQNNMENFMKTQGAQKKK
jgi:hypothetical protein